MEPARFDEMRRGCWDIDARIADMDLAGIWRVAVLPVADRRVLRARCSRRSTDPELGLACVRAWNDWHLEVWAGTHPDRIIPLQITVAARPAGGGRGACAPTPRAASRPLSFPENPAQLGLPVAAHRPLGSVPGRVRGDRDRRVPAHRLVVVDAVPRAGPAVRAVSRRCSR